MDKRILNMTKKIKFSNLILLVLIISGCGGGGGSSNSISSMPIAQGDISSNKIEASLYVPKENFETPEYKSQWGLDSINASSAYSLGGTGKGVIIGIIDEAMDWGHHEFLREDILHPDSLLTYSGNREPTPLEKFHGTATSSIIAGRKDDSLIPKNMHGVAFDSQILFVSIELGSPPSDGEYEPLAIEKFSWENYDTRESLFYKDISSKADVVNNSFGFTGQITDYSKEVLANTFPKFIKTLGEEQDTIFVWSAGNYNGIINKDGDKVSASSPGTLAGLGYYFPELATNNVAVVAVNKEGIIANFSNRCGVTKDFCIAAPGVGIPLAIPNNLFASLTKEQKLGFNEGVLSYLANHPSEAYLSGSGTSFSAPHVTGSLAVLFEIFEGNLSHTQILQRLYDTANKNGDYANKEIYGQGLLDLGAAASPVGLPLFYTGGSIYDDSVPFDRSYMSIGKSFGDGLAVALEKKSISFFDALGAPFFIEAKSFVNTKIPSSINSKKIFNFNKNIYKSSFYGLDSRSSWQAILNSEGISGFRLHDAKMSYSYEDFKYSLSYGMNPSTNFFGDKSFQLIIRAFQDDQAFLIPWTKVSEEGFTIGFSKILESEVLRVNVFSGSRRSDEWFLKPTFLLEHDGKTNGASFSIGNDKSSNYQRNFVIGLMNHDDGFFDHNFEGAFSGVKGSKSFFSAFNLNINLKNQWKFFSTVSLAKVNNINSNQFTSKISSVIESNFDLGFLKENVLIKRDIISFRIKQDPRIERADMTFNLPMGRKPNGEINFNQTKFSILPSGRELSFEAIWSYEKNFIKTSVSFSVIKDKENIKRNNFDTNFLIATKKIF